MSNNIGCLWQCGKIGLTRGLCSTCCNKARAMIRSGETTWEKLIAEGRAEPAKPKVHLRNFKRT